MKRQRCLTRCHPCIKSDRNEDKTVKHPKVGSGLRFLWLYLVLSVALLIGIWLVFDPPKHLLPYREQRALDIANMREIVRNNAQTILEDIELNDFSRTQDLLKSITEKPDIHVYPDTVVFDCFYFEGFFYTPEDSPVWVGGFYSKGNAPALKQEGDAWVWYENNENPKNGNDYRMEKICDHFWYWRYRF